MSILYILYRRFTVPCHTSQGLAGRADVHHSRQRAHRPHQNVMILRVYMIFFADRALQVPSHRSQPLSPCVTQREGWAMYTGSTVQQGKELYLYLIIVQTLFKLDVEEQSRAKTTWQWHLVHVRKVWCLEHGNMWWHMVVDRRNKNMWKKTRYVTTADYVMAAALKNFWKLASEYLWNSKFIYWVWILVC
jgi:hypothetical protein